MKRINNYLLLVFILTLSKETFGQSFSWGISKEEENFLFQVSSINDFIHRFNNDSTSDLNKLIIKNNSERKITRKISLYSVFNQENEKLMTDSVTMDFYHFVLDSLKQKYIHFSDSNWFAVVNCQFIENKKRIIIPVQINIHHDNRGYCWLINDVGLQNLDTSFLKNISTEILPNKQSNLYIPPTSIDVNFANLKSFFNTELNEQNTFEKNSLSFPNVIKFINLVKKGTLVFETPTKTKYYFFQIPGWWFQVSEFNRNTKNSGFLIDKVAKNSKGEKQILKLNILH